MRPAQAKEAQMQKPFTTVAAVLLLIVALAQATRAFLGVEVLIGGYSVPIVASWIAAAVAGLISVMLFSEARR